MPSNGDLIPAGKLTQYDCFQKENGTIVYKVMSKGATKAFDFDSFYDIFGVAYNGNMTKVGISTPVIKKDIDDMKQNMDDEREWNEKFAKD